MAFRKAIGIDHVTITPISEDGYKGITIIVNMFSGHAELYPYIRNPLLNMTLYVYMTI